MSTHTSNTSKNNVLSKLSRSNSMDRIYTSDHTKTSEVPTAKPALIKSWFEAPDSSNLKFSRANLRPMQEKDEKQVLQLLRELALYEGKKFAEIPIDEVAFIQHAFSNKYFNIMVVDYQNKIIGIALYFFIPSRFDVNKRVLFLNDLYVTPKYRGQCVGTTLLEEIKIIAKQEGCYRVEWELDKADEKAKSFYIKMGAVIENCSITYILKGQDLYNLASTPPKFLVLKNQKSYNWDYYTVLDRYENIIVSALTFQFYSTSKGYPVMYINDIYFADKNYEAVKSVLVSIAQSTVKEKYGRIQLRTSPGAFFINGILTELGGEFDEDYGIAKISLIGN